MSLRTLHFEFEYYRVSCNLITQSLREEAFTHSLILNGEMLAVGQLRKIPEDFLLVLNLVREAEDVRTIFLDQSRLFISIRWHKETT